MTRTINGIEFPDVEPVFLQTTLNLCRAQCACSDAEVIAAKLGVGPDDPVNLLDVLRVGGIGDCIWALRAVLPGQEADRDRVARLMAAEFAAEMLHHFEADRPDDKRPRLAIEAARDFAMGKIRAAALGAAWDAAWDAAGAAAGAAAWAAAWAAAGDAAWAAAGAAAWDAQRAIITRYLKA